MAGVHVHGHAMISEAHKKIPKSYAWVALRDLLMGFSFLARTTLSIILTQISCTSFVNASLMGFLC